MLSSPDPLNDSPTFQSPKPRRSSRVRHSIPLQGSSPTKQTFELDVGNQLSPQKIRVTVEAGSDTENGYTHFIDEEVASPPPYHPPVSHRRERTTTTTVPVKGLSDSEDEQVTTPKRSRGRPRKSGTPVPAMKGKRASTPIRKNSSRRKSIGDLVDGDDENDIDFHIGQGVVIGRGKGRSRSRSIKGTSRKSTPAVKQVEPSDRIVSSTTSRKGRGRRKTLLPDEVMVLEDENCGDKVIDNGASHELAELSGALDPIDTTGPPSTYSTIRSTTTIGEDVGDVVVARFDPGNETPRRTGWSSPRIIEAPRPSSLVQRATGYPSPSVSPTKSTVSQHEESVAMVPVSSPRRQSVDAYTGGPGEGHRYEEECEDGVGEPREFDTILESEGFSMISMDSVPSLREHLSSPTNESRGEESANPVRNKHLMAVQGKRPAGKDDSFSSIQDEILKAATPSRKSQNPNLLSVQPVRMDDSFSSIPPEILEAATPAKKSQISRLLPKNSNSSIEDSFSSIAPEILEAATPGRKLPKPAVSSQPQHNEAYEDSFSAIPPAILYAATPAPVRQMLLKAQTEASDRLSVPGPSTERSAQPNDPNSVPPRLLTPDETPSPPADVSSHQASKSSDRTREQSSTTGRAQRVTGEDSSLTHSNMTSSPPTMVPRRYTYTAHLRQHRHLYPDMTQTPSLVFSSPSLPPPIQPTRGQPSVAARPEPAPRPSLSPIVRAGRVLQDKIVPSSSPRSRALSLGSPFKSPVADRRSSSFAHESNPSSLQGRQVSQFPRTDLSSNLSAFSSRHGNWTGSIHQDDPFSNDHPSQQRSPLPEEKQSYSLELPEQHRSSDSRLTNIASNGGSTQSDDAMSWQAEEEAHLNDVVTSSANKLSSSANVGGLRDEVDSSTRDSTDIWERKWAAERAAVSKKIASADSSQVIVIDSDDENAPVESENENDDEDFGLLLATLNSSSPVTRQRHEPSKETVEKPRRSKLPSPWRKNSKRLVYNHELSHLSSPPKAAQPVAERVTRAKESAREATSQPFTVRRIVTAQQSSDDIEADLSGWQIPQKANFKPRARSRGILDLSAMLASSPVKALPVLSTSSQRPSLQKPSSNRSASTEESCENVSSVDTSAKENNGFTPIPQKTGFTPRVRDSSSGSLATSPVKLTSFGIFGGASTSKVFNKPTPVPSSSSASKPLAPSSPSKTNTLPYPSQLTPSAQLSPTFNSSYDSNSSSLNSIISHDEKENRTIDSRTLKWTQSIHLASVSASTPMHIPLVTSTSPTKSCLRSPLKTPSNSNPSTNSTSPSKTVAFVSSSPISSSPPAIPLSATKWSRDHWFLLDTILQSWKPENQSPETRRRNSIRVISKLLGKKVRAQGEKLRLEQWHLEVVDEFRGKVAGWEEGVVARRVFALLVGEERRGLGGKRKGESKGEEVGLEV